jgi:hypothetical protein
METTTQSSGYLRRLLGSAALDVGTYEEIETDERATPQAFVTVVLSSIAAGIGARPWGQSTVQTIVFATIVSLMIWALWALLTFEIGVRLMPQSATRSSVGELLRTIGFSTTPGFLRILGVLPGATTSTFIVSSVWMLAAMVVAVRQSLDYDSTVRAIAVCLLGLGLSVALAIGIGLLFGPAAY